MKKAVRLTSLAGVLASVCWFSVQEAQGGPEAALHFQHAVRHGLGLRD